MNSYKDKLRSDDLNWEFNNWDDEESWEAIERRLPKKKKRRFFIILFSGIGLLAAIGTTFFLSSDLLIDDQSEIVLSDTQSKSQEHEQKQEEESSIEGSASLHQELPRPIENPQDQSQQTNKHDLTIVKENIKDENVSSSTEISNYDKNKTTSLFSLSEVSQKKISEVTEQEVSVRRIVEPILSEVHNGEVKIKSELSLSKGQNFDQVTLQGLEEAPVVQDEVVSQSIVEESSTVAEVAGVEDKKKSTSVAKEFLSIIDKLLLIALKNEFIVKAMTLDYQAPSKLVDVEVESKKPIMFSLSGGYQIFSKGLTAPATIEDQNIQMRRLTESPEESIMISARLSKQILGNNWNIYSGLDYVQFNELVRHQFTTISEELIVTEQASYIVSDFEERFYFPGLITQTRTVNTTINKYNETYFVNMPIGIEYQHSFNKLTLGAGGGVVLSLYHNQQGDFINSDNKLIEKKIGVPVSQKLFSPIGYSGHLQLGYLLGTRTRFITTLRYQRLRSPIARETQIDERFKSVGVDIGVLFKL